MVGLLVLLSVIAVAAIAATARAIFTDGLRRIPVSASHDSRHP